MTVRMANGEVSHRCSECGGPVQPRHVLGGCVCDDCWDRIIGEELVCIEDAPSGVAFPDAVPSAN